MRLHLWLQNLLLPSLFVVKSAFAKLRPDHVCGVDDAAQGRQAHYAPPNGNEVDLLCVREAVEELPLFQTERLEECHRKSRTLPTKVGTPQAEVFPPDVAVPKNMAAVHRHPARHDEERRRFGDLLRLSVDHHRETYRELRDEEISYTGRN